MRPIFSQLYLQNWGKNAFSRFFSRPILVASLWPFSKIPSASPFYSCFFYEMVLISPVSKPFLCKTILKLQELESC